MSYYKNLFNKKEKLEEMSNNLLNTLCLIQDQDIKTKIKKIIEDLDTHTYFKKSYDFYTFIKQLFTENELIEQSKHSKICNNELETLVEHTNLCCHVLEYCNVCNKVVVSLY